MSPNHSESACKPKPLGKRLQALVYRLGRGEIIVKQLPRTQQQDSSAKNLREGACAWLGKADRRRSVRQRNLSDLGGGMTIPASKLAAALRFMEMAADKKRLDQARTAFQQAHGIDLISAYREAEREVARRQE